MARKGKKMDKKDRRNQKMWAEGAREDILRPHIPAYADALRNGWVAERDYFARVCNEYHALIHWRLADDEEPDLPLPIYDPAAPPREEELTAEEVILRATRIADKNGAIRRWLKYRVNRLQKNRLPTMNLKSDPYSTLLLSLTGVSAKIPKRRQGTQQLQYEQRDTMKAEVAAQWSIFLEENPTTSKKHPGPAFRAKVAKEMYEALSEEERETLIKNAEDERKKAVDAFKDASTKPPSKAPIDRQRCIDNLGPFLAPILEGIQDLTGLHCNVIVGGCMPNQNGEIGTLSFSRGFNRAASPLLWSQWQAARFNSEVAGFFKEYLETCFTSADRAAAALHLDDPLEFARYQMEKEAMEEGMTSESDDEPSDSEDDVESSRKRKRKTTRYKEKEKEKEMRKGKGKEKEKDMDRERGKEKSNKVKDTTSTTSTVTTILVPPAPTAPTPFASPPPLTPTEIYNRERNANIARHQALLKEMGLDAESQRKIFGDPPPKQKSTPKPRPKPRPVLPARRSMRLEPMDVDSNDTPSSSSPSLPAPSSPSSFAPSSFAPSSSSPSPPAPSSSAPSSSGAGDAMEISTEGEDDGTLKNVGCDVDDLQSGPSIDATTDNPPTAPIDSDPPSRPIATSPLSTNTPVRQITPNNALQTEVHSNMPQNSSTRAIEPGPLTKILNSAPTDSSSLGTSDGIWIPDNAPLWFKNALNQILTIRLGAEFDGVLWLLIQLERLYEFKNGRDAIPKAGRPDQLSAWIIDGRGSRSNKPQLVTDVDLFSRRWRAWWISIQPEWRGLKTSDDWPSAVDTYGEDWSTLIKPGANGVIGVVACLYWWGCAVQNKVEGVKVAGNIADWIEAVDDVGWVLQGLVQHLEMNPVL